jgi:hypothetical protein
VNFALCSQLFFIGLELVPDLVLGEERDLLVAVAQLPKILILLCGGRSIQQHQHGAAGSIKTTARSPTQKFVKTV